MNKFTISFELQKHGGDASEIRAALGLWDMRVIGDEPTIRLSITRRAQTFDSCARFLPSLANQIRAAALRFGWRVGAQTMTCGEVTKRLRLIAPIIPVEYPDKLPAYRPTAFSGILHREPQARILWDSLGACVSSDWTKRPHTLLHGPPGTGKTELLLAYARWLPFIWSVDGSTISKAGFERELVERCLSGTLAPVLAIEEIEKASASCLKVLGQLMDTRSRVERTIAGQSVSLACKSLVWASANDTNRLRGYLSGALWSRFALKLLCPALSREDLREVLSKRTTRRNVDAILALPGIEIREALRLADCAARPGFLSDYLLCRHGA